ncbi:MAG: penicillin-binding protein 1A [Arenicellales bacterium]
MRLLFRFFAKLFLFGFAFASAMGVGLAFYAISLLPNLPTVEQIRQIPLNIPLRIYSADQKLIAEYGNERRVPVTLDQAPPLLIDAILVTEDDSFYHHTGVDFSGILRAFLSNIRSQSRGQGASTITMQVVRNFFLNPEKTYTRKLKEILLAFNMERALTKDEILELYLNKIFLGHRAYGFAAAAQVYYGQSLENLSVPEIAMLAGLPKAPSRDNPISNPVRASERRDYVLQRLYDLGKIDKLSMETARKAPITAERHIAEVELQAPYVAEMARQYLVNRMGSDAYGQGLNVTLSINSKYQEKANQALRKGLLRYDTRHGFRGPSGKIEIDGLEERDLVEKLLEYPASQELMPAVVLSVQNTGFAAHTRGGEQIEVSLDKMTWAADYKTPNSQGPVPAAAGDVVSIGDVVYVASDEENSWSLSQLPEVSGALVSLDSRTGAILALTGGFDYYLSKFNRAVQAERQPGSNIKPFIYSTALDNGFTASSLVSGAPIVVEDNLEGIWRPENYSKKFFGPTRLRKALSLSLNLVSVRLLRAIGIEPTIQHLEKFGFDREALPRSLSLSLGSTTVTPIEIARGYAVFANGGKLTTPYFIENIEDANGNPVNLLPEQATICADCEAEEGIVTDTRSIPLAPLQSEPVQTVSPQNAFLTTSLMKQVILSGTGRKALALGRGDLAGKTGTTNNFRDAWFSGFNPDVTTTVFVGFDEPAHLGRRESGASAALPIWIDFMGTVLGDFPEQPQLVPEQIVVRFISKDTGQLTSINDPEGFEEYYLAGTEPTNTVQPLVDASKDGSTQGNNQNVSESLF